MSADDEKGDARPGELLDFQSYVRRKVQDKERAPRTISSSNYISLIRFAQRAEVLWRGQTPDLRRQELEHLDIRDRNGRAITGAEQISLLDLDRDFVAFRVAGLAARDDLDRRGATAVDAEATRIWDAVDESIACIADWD